MPRVSARLQIGVHRVWGKRWLDRDRPSSRAIDELTSTRTRWETHIEDRSNHHPVVLLQTLLVAFCKADRQLFALVVDIMPQSSRGELQSSKQPHQTFGGFSVLDIRVGSLFRREQALEGFAGFRVGSEIRSDFLAMISFVSSGPEEDMDRMR